MSRLVLLCLIAVCFCASAFERPDSLEAPQHPVASFDRHLRVAAHSFHPRSVTIGWNDSLRAEFTLPCAGSDDNTIGTWLQYSVFSGDNPIDRGECIIRYPAGDAALSIVLRADGGGALIETGTESCTHIFAVPFNRQKPVGTYISVPPDMKTLRDDMRIVYLPEAKTADFENVEALYAFLSDSADNLESLWQYLDRDTDMAMAVPGGLYNLATVSDGAGGYEIVYISGASHEPEAWPPLRIKGHMHPSGFAGNYDLEWIDAEGFDTGNENYATIEPDNGLLTFHFPLLNSRLRFRRLSPAQFR